MPTETMNIGFWAHTWPWQISCTSAALSTLVRGINTPGSCLYASMVCSVSPSPRFRVNAHICQVSGVDSQLFPWTYFFSRFLYSIIKSRSHRERAKLPSYQWGNWDFVWPSDLSKVLTESRTWKSVYYSFCRQFWNTAITPLEPWLKLSKTVFQIAHSFLEFVIPHCNNPNILLFPLGK